MQKSFDADQKYRETMSKISLLEADEIRNDCEIKLEKLRFRRSETIENLNRMSSAIDDNISKRMKCLLRYIFPEFIAMIPICFLGLIYSITQILILNYRGSGDLVGIFRYLVLAFVATIFTLGCLAILVKNAYIKSDYIKMVRSLGSEVKIIDAEIELVNKLFFEQSISSLGETYE
ncbi:hypothetical protein [Enterococcus sp. AZ012]|uniref:hypothetical protein n=1 Tax=unclassified Enterococcus TaxID=2608891 RepID=UPI003D2AEEA9